MIHNISLSSRLMSLSVYQRNRLVEGTQSKCLCVFKKILVEFSLLFIVQSALLEGTVRLLAYTPLLLLHRFTHINLENFRASIGSAFFTLVWAVVDLSFNFIEPVLIEHESQARQFASLVPGFQWLYRQQDAQFVTDMERAIAASLHADLQDNPVAIEEGTRFLVQLVKRMYQNVGAIAQQYGQEDCLQNAKAFLDAFNEADVSCIPVIMTEVVKYYVSGQGKTTVVRPIFIKEGSWNDICLLRRKQNVKFNELQGVAYNQMQCAILVTKCWEKAIVELPSFLLKTDEGATLIRDIMKIEGSIFQDVLQNPLKDENGGVSLSNSWKQLFTSTAMLRVIEYYVYGDGAAQEESPPFLIEDAWEKIGTLREKSLEKEERRTQIIVTAFLVNANQNQREFFTKFSAKAAELYFRALTEAV